MTFSFPRSKTFWILAVIVLIGAFFRLYNSYEGFRFLSDESAAMDHIEKIWQAISLQKWGALPLMGLPAGGTPERYGIPVPNGPLYYYLLTPITVISGFHPYGPALFVILLNIVAIYFMFLVGRMLFDEETGFLAALLLATSSFATLFSSWAWNPNLLVFFILVAIAAFFKIVEGKTTYWPVLGFSVIAITQLHALGYPFIFVVFIPLLLFSRIIFPTGKMLIATLALSFLPIFPVILSEFLSKFFYLRTVFTLQQEQLWFYNPGLLKDSFSLIFPSIKEMLGLNGSSGKIFSIALFSIVTVGTLLTLIRVNTLYSLRGGLRCLGTLWHSPKAILFVGWSLGSFLMAYLFLAYYGPRPLQHSLLFGLPLILLLYASAVRRALSRVWLIPLGIFLLSLFLYVNVREVTSFIWHPNGPTFTQEEKLVQYLKHIQRDQRYEIEIESPALAGSIVWIINRNSMLPPERVWVGNQLVQSNSNTKIDVLYSVVTNPKQLSSNCQTNILLKSFGALQFYQCLR